MFTRNVSRSRVAMRRSITAAVILIVVLLVYPDQPLWGWGFWAHRELTRRAVDALPIAMQPFFSANRDSIAAKSVEPDTRRSYDNKEAFSHYVDADRYGPYPFDALPRSYEQAVGKFGQSVVDSNGIVPWKVAEFTALLTASMKAGDEAEIVRTAAYLGHYIADSHVPLHTTDHYDGQKTGQRGIHARWESRIPERFGPEYRFHSQTPEYISDPLAAAFAIVLESHLLVDSVYACDLRAREGIPESELFTVRQRRGRTDYEFSDRYYGRFHELMNGMVERQLQRSIHRVASFWYTAWVDAGRPDLGPGKAQGE